MLKIKIIDVGTPNSHQSANGLEYQSIEVIYRDDEEQVLSKRLFSFSQKHVFKASRSWTKGTEVAIKNIVDAKGFTQWIDFTVGGELLKEDVVNDEPL
jgi:hypothetical protein